MIDLKKDKSIIEAATDGSWELSHTSQGDWIDSVATGSPVCMINGYKIDEDQERFDANYISNFDPIKMREYIAIAERETKQAERIEKLEGLLKVAGCPANCTDGVYADSHGDPAQCQFCCEREQILK